MSQEKIDEYCDSAKELRKLFWLNLEIAQSELVAKNSPVDFNVYKLICDTYECIISARSFMARFESMAMRTDTSTEDYEKDNEFIKEFNKLEETFDMQTLFLETLRSKPKAHTGD